MVWPGSKTTSAEVRRGVTYRDLVDILKARLKVDKVYNLNLKFNVLIVNLLSPCQPTGLRELVVGNRAGCTDTLLEGPLFFAFFIHVGSDRIPHECEYMSSNISSIFLVNELYSFSFAIFT